MGQAPLADESYWNANWQRERDLPRNVDPNDSALPTALTAPGMATSGARLRTCHPAAACSRSAPRGRGGCPNSPNISASRSSTSTIRSRAAPRRGRCSRAGLPGEVVCADPFASPPKLLGTIYRIHVPLRGRELAAAHERAGLTVVRCGYEMPANSCGCRRTDVPASPASRAGRRGSGKRRHRAARRRGPQRGIGARMIDWPWRL